MSDATTPPPEPPVPDPVLALPRRPRILTSLDRPFGLGFALVLGGLTALVLGIALVSLSTILVYIALAVFVALGLDPVVKRLERHGMSRPRGIAVVFGIFTVIVVVVAVFIVPPAMGQIAEFARSIPTAIVQLQASDWYHGFEAQIGDVVGTALDQLAAFLADPGNLLVLGGGVLAVGFGIGNAISGILIVIVLTLYFLASLRAFQTGLYRLAPARERATVAALAEKITDSVGAYLIGMVILAACNAAFATLLHLILGLPFPAFMGLAAFLITLIPLVGPVLYWIVASAVALFTNPLLALIFAVLYLIYMQFEAYLLTPRIMNKAIAVPGALVIIGALVGGTLLGLLGALVSIPVAAAILLIITQVVIPRQDAKT